jgi:hypothetical protein
VEELAGIRALVDHGEARLLGDRPDDRLLRLSRPERRRVLAVAAFRELRSLRREVEAERAAAEGVGGERGADDGHIDGV